VRKQIKKARVTNLHQQRTNSPKGLIFITAGQRPAESVSARPLPELKIGVAKGSTIKETSNKNPAFQAEMVWYVLCPQVADLRL
jgi:hypothetical protein